jgi:hypothetical protein
LADDYKTIQAKHAALMTAFLSRKYREQRGKEFAEQGFMRRIKSMSRAIENVFTLLPPERMDIPTREQRHDAEINIQAFLFNTFAASENLAWIWVSEKDVRKADGTELPALQVGLRKDRVLASFSDEFREYLNGLEPWFKHLEDFRHALAHRIPLYIPPYNVDPKNEEAYNKLQAEMNEASNQNKLDVYAQLKAKQEKLKFFRPWMKHSFVEKSKIVVFHAQMLADFNTIDELAWKVLKELDAKPSGKA